MIEITKKGIKDIPEDAKICPICGKKTDIIRFLTNSCLSRSDVMASMECYSCGTEWNYIPDEKQAG